MEDTNFEEDYFLGNTTHFTGGYELLTRLNRWRLKKFRKIIKFYSTNPNTKERTHRTLLDVGCGFGHFLDVLKDDFKVCGTDISNFGVKITKYKVRCPVEQGNCLEGLPFEGPFDIITAIDILEHLPNPKPALKHIFNSLSEEGYLFFEIPTINNKLSKKVYEMFFGKDKTHVFIKSVKLFEDLVMSVGFKKVALYSSLFPIFSKKDFMVHSFSAVFGVFKKGQFPQKIY